MKIKIQILELLKRFFLPWTITRFMFLFLGTTVFAQAAIDGLWIGIVFGFYFIATGLFAWGCAGGNCHVPTPTNTQSKEIEFEEIKN